MILEGLVTTISSTGELNIAPMGPLLNGPPENGFLLRPFQTATTFKNLAHEPVGVLHVTDDALMLARAAVSQIEPLPETFPAEKISGKVLASCCRWFEFRVVDFDDSQPRAELACDVVHCGELRPHWGFNRAKHAVLEAAIMATRAHLIPREEILNEFDRCEVIIGKTGGDEEHLALKLLREHVLASD